MRNRPCDMLPSRSALETVVATASAFISSHPLKRRVFFIMGTLFFSIGILGLIIPGLPTTIFMIIAAYFYFQSSNRFYNYIIQNDIFGDHVYNFLCGHGITKKAKQISLISMWFFIFIGISFGINSIPTYPAYPAFITISIILKKSV